MFDTLITSIENTFVQFSFRRLFYVLFLLAVISAALYAYNELTGFTFYTRLDKRLAALERLSSLEQSGVRSSGELGPIFQDAAATLREESPAFAFAFNPAPIFKFAAIALVPFLFVVYAAIQMLRRQPEAGSMFMGAVAITLLLGVPGVLLPTWHSIWWNVSLNVAVQLTVLVLLFVYGRRTTKTT